MYESYYGLNAKPFQLRPDPHFFFSSKGHKRAMAYLEYGLSQGEGFIVITGEVGAGKTTLVRNLLSKLESKKIVAAQIVNTSLNSDDALRSVVAAYGLPFSKASKTELLNTLEKFFMQCHQQGKRALLIVDEAQNLSAQTVEELRMLSNFQTADTSLLQTFLLGQPEFRKTLLSASMQQLRQRVIATYHLGPMDAEETRAYIKHRLTTVGWSRDPIITDDAFVAIDAHTGGIPRKINTLCDRLFLMGYLEELHTFTATQVQAVINDIQQEFELPTVNDAVAERKMNSPMNTTIDNGRTLDEGGLNNLVHSATNSTANIDERLARMERSVVSVLDALKKMVSTSKN
jgi:general secretion pathway protein A